MAGLCRTSPSPQDRCSSRSGPLEPCPHPQGHPTTLCNLSPAQGTLLPWVHHHSTPTPMGTPACPCPQMGIPRPRGQGPPRPAPVGSTPRHPSSAGSKCSRRDSSSRRHTARPLPGPAPGSSAPRAGGHPPPAGSCPPPGRRCGPGGSSARGRGSRRPGGEKGGSEPSPTSRGPPAPCLGTPRGQTVPPPSLPAPALPCPLSPSPSQPGSIPTFGGIWEPPATLVPPQWGTRRCPSILVPVRPFITSTHWIPKLVPVNTGV